VKDLSLTLEDNKKIFEWYQKQRAFWRNLEGFLFLINQLRYSSRTNTNIMKFNSPFQIVENFILWYAHEDADREPLIATIDNIEYKNMDDVSLLDDDIRVKYSLNVVLDWINTQPLNATEYVNMIGSLQMYFLEDHTEGLDSLGNYSLEKDAYDCIQAFSHLKESQICLFDTVGWCILKSTFEILEVNPSEVAVKGFVGIYNQLSIKQECFIKDEPVDLSDCTVTNKLIPFV